VTKLYYLELLRASEGWLSCWFQLYLQSLAPTPISKRVDFKQTAGRKNNCQIIINNKKHVVPTPLSGIKVVKRLTVNVDGARLAYGAAHGHAPAQVARVATAAHARHHL
jgi:hypothetical protein